MKILFTSLITLLLLPTIGISQDFSFVEGNLVEKDIVQEDFENGESKILNSSDVSVVYEWEMITFDNPFGWDFSICDYTVCYTGGETTGTMTAVDAGTETAFLRVNVVAFSAGVGTYEFVVWDQAFPDVTDTIKFVLTAADAGDVSIGKSLTADKIGVTTTSQNQVAINNSSSDLVNYSVLNISGQVISQGTAYPNENSIIDTSTLNSGLYLLSFQHKGKMLKTEKIIIR